MQPKLIIGFTQLGDADFAVRAETIVTSLTGNATFPEPWPQQLPSLATLSQHFETYQDAFTAAQSGDRQKIALRIAARKTLNDDLRRLAPYLEVIAAGDTALLLSTGYELRRDTAKSNGTAVLAAPDDFRVDRGPLSGTLIVRARRLPGAGAYEVQTAQADPTVESNWADAGTYKLCSRIELEGLTPGKTVSVRLRGIGSTSPGAWTPAASLMVV